MYAVSKTIKGGDSHVLLISIIINSAVAMKIKWRKIDMKKIVSIILSVLMSLVMFCPMPIYASEPQWDNHIIPDGLYIMIAQYNDAYAIQINKDEKSNDFYSMSLGFSPADFSNMFRFTFSYDEDAYQIDAFDTYHLGQLRYYEDGKLGFSQNSQGDERAYWIVKKINTERGEAYAIANKAYPDKVFDIDGANIQKGTKIKLEYFHDNNNEPDLALAQAFTLYKEQ